MVSVPKYGGGAPTVQPANNPFGAQNIQTSPQDFGADVGQALVGVGQQVAGFGDVLTKHAEEYQGREDSLQARNALISAREKLGQMEAGYQTQQGMNAHQGFQPYSDSVKKLREDSVKGLNPRAADIFGRSFDPQISQALDSGAKHAATQFRVVETAQATALTQQYINDAGVDPLDERRFKENVNKIRYETYSEAQKAGSFTPGVDAAAQADEQANKFISVAWQNRLVSWARTDPGGATRKFNEIKDTLDPNVRYNLENYLGTQRRTIGNAQAVEDITSGRPPGTANSNRYLSTLPGNTGNANTGGFIPQFADAFTGLHQAAIRDGIPGAEKVGFLSGYRDFQTQQRLNWEKRVEIGKQYGLDPNSPTVGALAAHWVAPAGESEHQYGTSGDLSFDGTYFQKRAPAALVKYYHDNAEKYGLQFRMGHEPWHISLIGPAGKGAPYTPGKTSNGPAVNGLLNSQYQSWYDQNEAANGLPSRLLWAQGQQESSWNPNVVGDGGKSIGIAQFSAGTAKQFGLDPSQRTDPKLSIEAQGRAMAYYMKKSGGDLNYALAAYNWGEANADAWLSEGGEVSRLPPGVQNYIAKIKGFMSGGPGGTVLTPQSAGDPQTLDFHIQQAKDYAIANGYNAYDTQALIQDVRTRHEVVRAEGERIEQSNSMAVMGAIMGPPTGNQAPLVSRDQLPERERQIYNAMPPDRRAAMDSIFAANATNLNKKQAPSTAMYAEYDRLSGMRLAEPEKFAQQNFGANPLLTDEWKKQFIDQARSPELYKNEVGAQLFNSLQFARPQLEAFGLNLWPTEKEREAMTNEQRAKNQRFISRWAAVSQAFAESHNNKSPMTDPTWVIETVGYMLRPITVDIPQAPGLIDSFMHDTIAQFSPLAIISNLMPFFTPQGIEALKSGEPRNIAGVLYKPQQLSPFETNLRQIPSSAMLIDIPEDQKRLLEQAHEIARAAFMKKQALLPPDQRKEFPSLDKEGKMLRELYYKNLTMPINKDLENPVGIVEP